MGLILSENLAYSKIEILVDSLIELGRFNDAAVLSYDLFLKNPQEDEYILKGAFSLFQMGYSSSALIFLKYIPSEHWKKIGLRSDHFLEIISLLQKKVPLSLLKGRLELIDEAGVPSYLQDELKYAKGRAAFERRDYSNARILLSSINSSSGFNARAQYLLAVMELKEKKYSVSSEYFSKVFDLNLLQQSSEFWSDMTAQVSSHWGTSLRVNLNTELLLDNALISELTMLALARVAYSEKLFEIALSRYSKIQPSSRFYNRAQLETVWTLLSLNRHDEAQKLALSLGSSDFGFESIEARITRALVLTDSHRTSEARESLTEFDLLYKEIQSDLKKSELDPSFFPSVLEHELASDQRIVVLDQYETSLSKELLEVGDQERQKSKVFSFLRPKLLELLKQIASLKLSLRMEHVSRRLSDLKKLKMNANLIRAETYLDDRDQMEFSKKKTLMNPTRPEVLYS
jgi:hypothetical protein